MLRAFRTAKLLLKSFVGKDLFIPTDVNYKHERFGSAYGGWDIVVDNLNSNSVVYSFGIGEDISFEQALVERFGLEVHAFDPTPKALDWVLKQTLPPEITVHEYGLAHFDGELLFNPPVDPTHVSYTIVEKPVSASSALVLPVKKLKTIFADLNHTNIDILKMDIEGAEYQVIENIAASSIRPYQVLVEFHHRCPQIGIQQTKKSIKLLKSLGYRLFSISETGVEFGFKLVRN